MQDKIIDLNTFGDGSLNQKVQIEMQRIIENINDPNTNPTKARTLTIKISFAADEEREYIDNVIDVQSSLVGYKPAKAKMIMGKQDGKVTARELVSGKKGQMFFDPQEGVVKTDIGQKVEEVEKNEAAVVSFKGAASE